MIDYICTNCKCRCQFSKERSKCPNCNKMKLLSLEFLEGSDLIKNKEPAVKSVGERIFKENKFVDDKTMCSEDLEFNKKIKFSVSRRESRKVDPVEVECHSCHTKFITKYPDEKRCKNCCSGA